MYDCLNIISIVSNMTQEEKAKAYDEALERARKYMAKGYDVLMPEIFPQLRESEDERIRKEIINYLDFAESHNLLRAADYEKKKGWLAYLEKKKEQKPAWSEDEMKVLDSIIDDYEAASKSFCGYDGKIGLLKAIRDGEYDLSKQEWSEEDERMLSRCEKSIESSKQFADSDTFKKAKDNEIDWLENRFKSLRPSWKPTKEQMKALADATMRDVFPVGYRECLETLYEQLKKLYL